MRLRNLNDLDFIDKNPYIRLLVDINLLQIIVSIFILITYDQLVSSIKDNRSATTGNIFLCLLIFGDIISAKVGFELLTNNKEEDEYEI